MLLTARPRDFPGPVLQALIGRASTAVAGAPLFWGIVLMLLTTSLWALAFVAPLALAGASAAEVTMGRFIVYGLISLFALRAFPLRRLTWPIALTALLFALAGNIVYYYLLVLGIQLAGAPIAVLIIGMLPVTVSLFGRLRMGEGALRAIAAPLLLFAAGILLFNLSKTDFLRDVGSLSGAGLACILASMCMWTWYAAANAGFLRKHSWLSAGDWSSVVGIASLLSILVAAPLLIAVGALRNPLELPAQEMLPIAFWSILLGGGATWLGTLLFNAATKLLSVTLLGQLIIFEAIFGLAYVFLVTGALPTALELAGIGLALLAVWWSIRRLQRRP